MIGAVSIVGVAVLAAVPALDTADWSGRRPALKQVFMEREYGVRPVVRPSDLRFETSPDVGILGGTAVRREVKLTMTGPRGPFSFKAVAYVPGDAKRVAVIGHSRGGKTALWAGVTDERFALACVNESGCSGAKLNHMDLPKSEPIATIVKNFPHWFCPNYFAYAGKEMEMDFDQHQLVALMAPRAVAVADATLDDWAGQAGEFRSCELASPAWAVYGKKGLVAPNGMPAPDTALQDGWISYHLRTGKHELAPFDWARYMDFADKRL